MSPRAAKLLISGPPLVYLLVFFAIPTLIMVLASFRYAGELGGLAPLVGSGGPDELAGLTLENYQRFFGDSIYLELFLKSFLYASTTTLLCLVLARPAAAPTSSTLAASRSAIEPMIECA